MEKRFFVYSYNMGINEYFYDRDSAIEYVEEIVRNITDVIDNYGLIYDPDKTDLIVCETIADVLAMPGYTENGIVKNYPYLEMCY